MKDISEHLHNAHKELKLVYEHVNERQYEQASHHAEEALFHSRCAVLWLKERLDDPTAPDR
jgi:uncharacterized protein (UPF0332 family)